MSELSEYTSRLEVPYNDGALLSYYRDVPDPDGYVELGEIEGHTPYGPTPCKPFAYENREFQLAILHNLAELASQPYPVDTPSSVAEVIEIDFLSGFVRREETNHTHYLRWSELGGSDGTDEYNILRQDDYFSDIIDRAERGYASPEELIQLMQNSSMHATNITSMAIPYGRRAKYVPQMREEVANAITRHGGIIYAPSESKYRNIKAPGVHGELVPVEGAAKDAKDDERTTLDVGVMLTTYKRDVGAFYANDGTLCKVVERQAIAIRTDEASGFPQDVKEMLGKHVKSDEFKDAWEFVRDAYIQEDVQEPFLIPLSVSVYAHRVGPKPKTTGPMLSELQLRKEAEEKARNMQLANIAVGLTALMEKQQTIN